MTNPLLLPISSLNRVGNVVTKYLSKLISGNRVFDLLLHKPVRAEKILFYPRVFEVANGQLVVLKLKVESHVKPENKRQPYKIVCSTPSGYVNLVFFKIFPSQLQKMKIGNELAVLGYLERSFIGKKMELQISHPQEILPVGEIEKMPKLNVIYPLTAGITQRFLTQKIREVLAKVELENEEWIDGELVKRKSWPSFSEALKLLHHLTPYPNPLPQGEREFLGALPLRERVGIRGGNELGRERLAYDEFLAWQIAVLLAKKNSVRQKKLIKAEKNLANEFIKQLPFELTKSQLQAITEIEQEIFSNKKMLRLLQGDVGSGKTVVAITACLNKLSQKQQSCIIVPISILAKQHYAYLQKLLQGFDITIEILTSATTNKQRTKILNDLSEGKIDILISTHAVLEDDVKFKNLGLAVIDEQHRFGVIQRLKLVKKGEDVDVLLMSATPIPRSLMMGLYGDMDISILSEKPKNRQKIETLVISEKKLAEVYQAMKRAVARGEKMYWICPMIEENAEINLTDVTKKYKELTEIFGEKDVALIHGKMKEREKEKIMLQFIEGEAKILVATTVIEVGIDVPDATIILIENAENFGLSQLHQLRGRVGRSSKKSFCILLYGEKFGATARKRLGFLRESNDGFFIAEEDLKLRGSGDLLGTKQSGFPEFRIADFNFDSDLLKIAHKNAQVILNADSDLKMPQSRKYQDLLKLFHYDECLKNIDSG